MSYQSISVKEAIQNINATTNGWFLPAIQRPYVWGSRYQSEKFICKLFDSILRGYPIGGLIIWNTDEKIGHREFINDYNEGDTPPLLEEGLWSRKDKWLVYDGQQRLQTLYSCLKYTFNDKVLVFDLLFNRKDNEDEETGFSFVIKNSKIQPNQIRMNELFTKNQDTDEEIDLRSSIIKNHKWNDKEIRIIEKNLHDLWKIFVELDKKSLAYFPITTKNESEVNEIFQRLNSGGIQLSQADLLLSLIKEKEYDFEERLSIVSKEIYNSTNKGYIFDAYNILQLIHLIIKGKTRVDPKLIKKKDLNDFILIFEKLQLPLKDFFSKFIYGQFKINSSSIIPRNQSLLPLIIYIYELYDKGVNFNKIQSKNLIKMNKFFIKSQINDWNLQSYIDNFTKIIIDKSIKSKGQFDFPLEEIEKFISDKGSKREITIKENLFIDYRWFALKILTPNRLYQFEPDIGRRFNPEIDHIFPIGLKGKNDKYKKDVNILWNFQPINGEINGFKSNHHPLDFFTDKIKDKNKNIICGSKYIQDYDFLPNILSEEWKDYKKFISFRRNKMIEYLKEKYDIELS